MGDELPGQAAGRPTALSPERHSGVVTLLFTDVVGSTALKQQLGDAAGVALVQEHHALVRELLKQFPAAEEISTAGDSFFLAFPTPSDGVCFALLLQSGLRVFNRGRSLELRDRVALHLGEVVIEPTAGGKRDLHGMQVDTCARVMSLAQAGQILMTRPVFDNARQSLKGKEVEGVGALSWLNHGRFELKGVEEPLEICEVRFSEAGTISPPATSEKARRVESAEGEAVLGWRPAIGQEVPNTKWVLEEKLGEGGFGEVWKARHEKLNEFRVFKFCFRADRVRSLKREVTLFRLLKERVGEHPNIVKLHDIYFDHPPFYLEEEYVPGRDLRKWCELQGGAGRIPLDVRLELVAQAAEALQAAHDAGVIHRDVKPGNILVSNPKSVIRDLKEAPSSKPAIRSPPSEILQPSTLNSQFTVKLTDFGIGQVISEEVLKDVTRAGFTQTLSGSTSTGAGTTMYLAPEIVAGMPATTRSDIYSLGVVLYQLLIGTFGHPLTADWARDVADPLLRHDLELCFAWKPEDRFTGAGQLAKNLRALPERRAEEARQAVERAAREQAAYRRGMLRTAGVAAAIVTVIVGLALVAASQSRRAKATAAAEKQERERAERNLYAANMNLAQQAWEQNNIGLVRQLLSGTASFPERRFEWYYWQRQAHLDLKTLRGHTGGVRSLAVSPDGQRLITGSDDSTAKIWGAATGEELLTLRGHRSPVTSVAFSPDGRRIVTGSEDGTSKVWGAADGKELLSLKTKGDPIWSAAVSPDGRRIVTGGDDGTALLWEASGNNPLLTLGGHSNRIYSVSFSPDGRRILTGSEDQRARVWDATAGNELFSLEGHSNGVLAVAFSPDGRWLLTGSLDRTAKVWDAANGKQLHTLSGHGDSVCAVAYSPDGQRIATGSWDRMAKLWDAAKGRELSTLKGHAKWVTSVAFSPDGRWIVTGSLDHTAKVWDAAEGEGHFHLKRHSSGFNDQALSPDSRRMVTGGQRSATVWDATNGEDLLSLGGSSGGIACVAFSRDGTRIVTGGWDNLACVWDSTSGKSLCRFEDHRASILVATFSPDGRRVVTGGADGAAWVWDAASGKPLLPPKQHGGAVWAAAFSPDGRRIVTGGGDVSFSPDNQRFVLGSGDRTAKVWDAFTGEELFALKGHGAHIVRASFSPDGRRILTCGCDQTARVWDAAEGKLLLTLEGHDDWVLAAAFSPDSRRIVTGSIDRTVKLWESASGKELLTLKGHNQAVTSAAFFPDGRRLVTGGWDGTTRLWEAATTDQATLWQREEKDAAERVAVLQREEEAAAELVRMQRARDPGAIKQWLVLAPIPFRGQTGDEALDQEQIHREAQLRPRAGEVANAGGTNRVWRAVQQTDYLIDFTELLGGVTEWSVGYAVCYIHSEAAQTGLRMKVGSDDQAKVYLNGREIYRHAGNRAWIADEDSSDEVELQAGLNVLVLKVVNEAGGWQASVWLTDATGQPVKGIRLLLTPP